MPFNLTGLRCMAIQFGRGSDGMSIGVQLVSIWLAESTLLHAAAQLESVSTVRHLQPSL